MNKYLPCILMLSLFCSKALALEITAGPYLQNPSENTMTVMWITDKESTSWIEYGNESTLNEKAFQSSHGLIDAGKVIHRITINNLKEAGKYHYRTCSKEILEFQPYKVTYGQTITSNTYSFQTLSKNKEKISFVVLNDIHQRPDLINKLMQMSESKPYELVFLNGDILGHIEDHDQIVNNVIKPCSEIFAKEIPFIYVRGNHETRGKYARMLPLYLASPQDKYYYSFDHGPVHFIIMDGGEDKEDINPAYSGLVDFDRYRDQQTRWLKEEVKSKSFREAVFKVVIMHMPPTRSDKWHGTNDLYNKWRPAFNEAGIDLMISGHTHEYTIEIPQKGVRSYPMIIGGSPKEGNATVIRVDGDSRMLNITMTLDNGQVVGTYKVTK